MQFSDLIGQQAVINRLRQMIDQDRLPHAQLLLGPPGSGKLAIALVAARYLLCTDRTPDGACNECPACRKVNKLVHPDLHFSFPTVGSKMVSDNFLPQWREKLQQGAYFSINDWLQHIGAENKQGNITKDECLNIIRKLSLKTFESDYKVLIMWLPEYLGAEGNRLLKLIEEPPEKTVFLLVAEDQDKILNTILSRCQLVKVPNLSDEDIKDGLISLGHPAERATAISRLVDGDFSEALHLIQGDGEDHAHFFIDWFRECYRGQAVNLVKRTNSLAELGRENQKHFLRYAMHFLRELMLLKALPGSQTRLQAKELAVAEKMQTVVDFDQIEAIVKLLTDVVYYVERNANPKILFLDTSIQVHHILRHGVSSASQRA